MKPTFLSTTLRAVGVIAAIATVATTVVQQTAEAQMNINVPADIDDEACIASGVNSFYLLQNIDLSSEQAAEIFQITEQQFDAYDRLIESYPAVDDLSGNYSYMSKPGVEIPPDVSAAIDEATRGVTSGEAVIEQIAALNEQFGQYVEFTIGEKITITPAQTSEINALEEESAARSLAVMTSEQQQQYQENLVTEKKINEACGIVRYDRSTADIYR
jgi:hypothetical protein